MKVFYECGPCFLRQAREAMDLATDDEELKMEIIAEIFKFLADCFSKDINSNKTGSLIHNMIKEKTHCDDPYKKEKIRGNEIALKYLPTVEKMLKKDTSLENYVKMAIVGNILDFGSFKLTDDIEMIIKNSLDKNLAINDVDKLETDLNSHNELLYLLDNTGEIIFDKLLLEKLKSYGVNITVVVKEKPILNDACLEDALEAGLDDFAKIIDMASTVGIVYEENSQEFKDVFDSSDFIISKGMGNFEGLTELDLSSKNIYFLLATKCTAISKFIGTNLGDMVLLKSD